MSDKLKDWIETDEGKAWIKSMDDAVAAGTMSAALRDAVLNPNTPVLLRPGRLTDGDEGAARVQRLIDAVEGECHGLAISEQQARAILAWVLYQQVVPK